MKESLIKRKMERITELEESNGNKMGKLKF